MKTTCVIAEFNPFHNGHQYIAQKARKLTGADYVAALMSGNFVQRGAPAIMSRQARAKMALTGGFDMIVAFPTRYATCSAEEYAANAVRMADELGCFDTLFFGSECGDIERLRGAAEILSFEPEEYRVRLQEFLRQGFPFPKARAMAMPDYEQLLGAPNNILGVEYIKAILRRRSSIVPLTCKRIGTEHASRNLSGTFTSATAIRSHLLKQGSVMTEAECADLSNSLPANTLPEIRSCVPARAFSILKDEYDRGRMLNENNLSFLLAASIWQAASPDDLTKYLFVTPQLANAVFSSRAFCTSFEDFAMLLKNRSLTLTHITRALLHIALKIEKDKQTSDIAHILGIRKEAGPLISHMKETSTIPVIMRPSRDLSDLSPEEYALFDEEIQLSNLYNVLISQKTGEPVANELSHRLITV